MSNEITTLGLSDLQEPQEQRPEDHLAGAIGLPPEQGASALRSARANEVPPVVARSGGLPEVRPLGLADLQAMPGVARAITSPESAAAVKDDGEGLSRTQRAANSWKRGVLAASGTGTAINLGATVTEYAKYQEASRLADEGASEARIRAQVGVMGWDFARLPAEVRQRRLLALKLQIEPQVAESSAMLAEVERRKALLPAGDQMREWQAQEGFTAALSFLLKNPSLALDIIPESAAQQAAAIPLGVIGPAGVGAGAMVTGYPQGLLQQLQQAGVDTTSGEAIRAALNDPAKRQQILQGAAGYGLGLGIVEAYTAGLSRFVRPFGAKASSVRTREPIVIESGADVALNTGTKLLAEGTGGAASEVLASGGTASAQDVLGEFFGEVAMGGPMDLVSMRVGAMQESRAKAEEAKAVADYMDRVAKVAAATKIAGRDPKTLGDIVENMAADAGAPTTLYVTSEDLADALHQAKVSLNDFAAMMPEHSTAIIEGFLEGTAVPLPVSSLMQVAAQNPALNEALTQKVRPTEDGMSAAEATEFLQSTYNTRIVEEADKILSGLSARSPMRASSEALRKRVEADLIAAGQSPKAAAKQARLTAAFFTTASADMQDVSPGITPEEVFRKWYPDGVAMVSGQGAQAAGQEMSQYESAPRLSAVHNLSADNLEFADKMGGIAVPSIGVITESAGGVEGFGEITLIGTKGMADPSAEPVFSSDAYTARFPRPVYKAAKTKDADKLVAFIKPWSEKYDDADAKYRAWESTTQNPDPQDLISRALRSRAWMGAYLDSIGKPVEPIMRKKGMRSQHIQPEMLEELRTYYDAIDHSKGAGEILESPEFAALAEKAIGLVNKFYSDIGLNNKQYDASDFGFAAYDRLGSDLRSAGEMVVDIWPTTEKMQAAIEPHAADFKKFVEGKVLPMMGEPMLQVGRKKLPYTLQNIVEYMTSEKVRGEEKTMTYGAGMARSATAEQFKDLDRMREVAKETIVDSKEYNEKKKETDQLLSDYRSAVADYYEGSTWDAMDSAMKAIARWGTGQVRGRAQLVAALKKEGFKSGSIPGDILDHAMKAGNALLDAPVPYFEAKPQRAVTLDEFAGAVIPGNASAEVRAILDKHGIKYREYSEDAGRTAAVREFTKELADARADVFFQRQEEVRGAYSMRTNLLRLTQANNASTFLHESGHQFLDLTVRIALMPNASPAIVKRADAILKWLGIEAEPGKTRSEVYLDMDIETLRPYHEKFAESFEAYLFKGQAPSLDLAEAFRAFKTWLKSVYRNLQSFLRAYPDAKLDPEITALMDRMLATDEQIAEAKASRAVIPLFDAKPESMTVEQWQAYLDDMRTLNEEAAEHIDEKRLADMQYLRRSAGKVLKQMQKDAAEKRAAARMEATRQVLSQPVYRLRQLLEAKPEPLPRKVEAKGLDTGVDSLAVAIAKLGGLNRDEAVAEWGIDPADFQHLGPRNKPVLRTKGGMSPGHLTEVLAEYGYLPTDKDGKADMNLLADRLDAEARGDKQYSWQADWSRIFADDFAPIPDIEENPFAGARLDRYWLESKYAGDERMQVLLPLLWPMATKTTGTGVNPDDLAPLFGYGSGDEMVRALVESRPTQEAIDSLTDRLMIERHGDIESPEALARLVDEAIMSRHRSRVLATELSIINAKAGKPSAILKAAKEAAGNIIDSVKVGALRPDKYKMAAARAGRDAMNAMARGDTTVAATAKQAQVLNVELFNDATREKQAVADFLKETRKWFGDDEKIAKSRNMDMVILARSILGRYGMTSEGRAEDAVAARARLAQYNPQIAADLTDIEAGLPQGTDYSEMTVADVRAIRTVAEAVWNMSRSDKTMLINGRRVEKDELAAEFNAAIGSAVVVDAAIGTKTTMEKMSDWAVSGWAYIRRVQSWADQYGDVVKDIITRPLNDGIEAHKIYFVDKSTPYAAAIEKIKDRLDSSPIYAPELGTTESGKPVTLANGKLELLHAMLHTGNISNRDKMLMGRRWTDSKAGDEVISTAKWDKFMSRMHDEKIITKAEWDFCQEVWDILESMKPDAQKAHHAMFGYHFDEVTAVPVVTPFGIYRGGYVPAIADRSDATAASRAEAEELLHAGNSFMFPTTGKGFTKSRVEGYYRPLELDLRTITTHIDKVSRFIHIEPAVRDVISFIRRDDVSAAIEKSFPGFLNYGLNPWLQRAARQSASDSSAHPWIAGFIRGVSRRVGLNYISFNVLNAIQGVTGIGIAYMRSDISASDLNRAVLNYTRQRTAMTQRAKNMSPYIRNRVDHRQQEVLAQVKNLVLGKSPIDLYEKGQNALDKYGYVMQNMVQNQIDVIVWTAAYDSAVQRDAINPIADADEAVRLTQQTTAPEDIAAYEGGLAAWLTKFGGYFNMVINALSTEQKKAMGLDGTAAKVKRMAYLWSVFMITNAVAEAMVHGGPDDDEDEEDGDVTAGDWVLWFLGAQATTMTAMIPYIGKAVNYAFARADDNPVNDRLTVSPAIPYLEGAGGGFVTVATGAPFSEEEMSKKEVKDILTLTSLVTGIPMGQINKAVGYTMDVESGRQSPEGAWDATTGLLSGKQW